MLSFLNTGGNTRNVGEKVSIYEATTLEAGRSEGGGLAEEAVQQSHQLEVLPQAHLGTPGAPKQSVCSPEPAGTQHSAQLGNCDRVSSQPSQSRLDFLNPWFLVRDVLPTPHSRGYLVMFGDSFGGHDWGGVAAGS